LVIPWQMQYRFRMRIQQHHYPQRPFRNKQETIPLPVICLKDCLSGNYPMTDSLLQNPPGCQEKDPERRNYVRRELPAWGAPAVTGSMSRWNVPVTVLWRGRVLLKCQNARQPCRTRTSGHRRPPDVRVRGTGTCLQENVPFLLIPYPDPPPLPGTGIRSPPGWISPRHCAKNPCQARELIFPYLQSGPGTQRNRKDCIRRMPVLPRSLKRGRAGEESFPASLRSSRGRRAADPPSFPFATKESVPPSPPQGKAKNLGTRQTFFSITR